MYKLDQNLKTTIATKFGQRDTIDIEDRIRQGRSLLGLEFALLYRSAKYGHQSRRIWNHI